jgi:hypothetical protein
MNATKAFFTRLMPIVVAAAAAWPDSGRAQSSSSVDPEAMRLLHASADYLAGLKQFDMQASSSLEAIASNGQKLEFEHDIERLSEGVTSAMVVGEAYVGDVRCKHVAFRNAEVDWQLYVEEGATPLPRKFVVTSKKMPQSPSFYLTVSKWDTAPKLKDAMFTFTPPNGAIKIDFLRRGALQKAR